MWLSMATWSPAAAAPRPGSSLPRSSKYWLRAKPRNQHQAKQYHRTSGASPTARPAPTGDTRMPEQIYKTGPGRSHPLGAVPDARGVNFAIFSRYATAVQLLIFREHDDVEPTQVIALDPAVNKSFFFWHVYVEGLKPGAHYAYRVDGPRDLHGQGFRFDPSKVLIDPYARGNSDAFWNRADACRPGDNLKTSMRSVVIVAANYSWEGDQALNTPTNSLVI